MSKQGRTSLASWASADFPQLPFVAVGLGGSTLLLDLLRQSNRRTFVLPAFICPELPAMGIRAGVRLLHVDGDRRTMHMDPRQLDATLSQLDPGETVLLVDHTFGYPDREIARIRRTFPDLLIIEDCVRALGSEIDGMPVGQHGDCALFSMYKTTLGNENGAVLLTRSPYAFTGGGPGHVSLREWAAGVPPLRFAHGLVKRLGPPLGTPGFDHDEPTWMPVHGTPSRLCTIRFERELAHSAEMRDRRWAAAQELQTELSDLPSLQFISVAPGCRPSAFYLSLTVAGKGRRNALVTDLQRRGHFLAWAWNSVPAHYRCFAGTFPHGSGESLHLAEHVLHIPLSQYLSSRRRRSLVVALRRLLGRDT